MDSQAAFRAIRSAIRTGDTATALSLLRADKARLGMLTPFGSWLHVAATFGNLELVEALVSLGVEVNQRSGTFDSTPINHAASEGHIEIVRFLLNCGAELDQSDPQRNPLFGAILGGHLEVVRLLIDSGIDHRIRYNGPSMKDMDALAFARERGEAKIAEFLESV